MLLRMSRMLICFSEFLCKKIFKNNKLKVTSGLISPNSFSDCYYCSFSLIFSYNSIFFPIKTITILFKLSFFSFSISIAFLAASISAYLASAKFFAAYTFSFIFLRSITSLLISYLVILLCSFRILLQISSRWNSN